MISPDLNTLTEHMVAQLGPQLRPRSGSDAGPQPSAVGLRNLRNLDDLRSASASSSSWGVAQGVLSAVQVRGPRRGAGGGRGGGEALLVWTPNPGPGKHALLHRW